MKIRVSGPRALLALASLIIPVVLIALPLTTASGSIASIFTLPQPRSSFAEMTVPLSPAAKIAPEVRAETADGKPASVVVMLTDQADVSAAYAMADRDARGWYVYRTLTGHAEASQLELKAFLTQRGATYRSFWAANILIVEADQALIDEIAQRPDVARIDSNRPQRWIEDPEIANERDAPEAPEAAEWGVTRVNAPQLWEQGFTGQGMVVGNLDTGVRWTHTALRPKYRGWNGTVANHNYNWWDAVHTGGGSCGPNTTAPCDDNGHGTHTTGTSIGDDGGANQVGVAPGAKWIGCRNMNAGVGSPATYTECFQFMLAPTDITGANPDPARRPHVLNNSWGCPTSEGCTTRAELETIVNNTDAAGIFVVVSAGNSGSSGCSSVSAPPAIYDASFSVGATDVSNNLASFSSRGPSTFYTPNLLKPNISAPGVNVRSATRTSDNSFGSLSGTSMAGPHVAGVVALLWSARPSLVGNNAATRTLLQNTANPTVNLTAQTCGGTPSSQIPNNSFGYGRIDVLAAFAASGGTPSPTPTPTVTPTNTPTATPTNTPTATPTGTPSQGLEGDVAPRPNGDGSVLATDVTQVRRFATGLDTPTSPEALKADSAPRGTLGDGAVDASDVVQARRYATGLDPVTQAGGPTASAPTAASGVSTDFYSYAVRYFLGTWFRV